MIRVLVAAALIAAPALAAPGTAPPPEMKQSESVWTPAPTPPGGVPWQVLESAKEAPGNAMAAPKPLYPKAVTALAGKRIKVNGYMLPLGKGGSQSHFVLLAYPPDCPFHLNPGPAQFIEVKVKTPVQMNYQVRTIEGTLELAGNDGGGVFYKISDGREL